MPEGGKIEVTEISTRRYISTFPVVSVDVCNFCAAVVFDPISHYKWHEAQARMMK